MEEEGSYEKDVQPEDIIPDEDAHYGSEDENFEQKPKEKPVGPPLELDVPLVHPPGRTDRVSCTSVSKTWASFCPENILFLEISGLWQYVLKNEEYPIIFVSPCF